MPVEDDLRDMAELNNLPADLQFHYQFHGNFCAVSAFESIAKLHRLIKPDAFPLQSNIANQAKGFGDNDTVFLKSLGLTPNNRLMPVPDALDLIESETREGRFPLAAQVVGINPFGGADVHIFICCLYAGKLLLIDPATPKIQAEARQGLEAEFLKNIQRFPVRKEIHVLWYSMLPNHTQKRDNATQV
jgi:hypothetical protein